MKIKNSIGWCDETINGVTGCDKVSAGCKNCYAQVGTRARVLRGQGIETWGPQGVRHPVNFEPVFRRLNKLCICDKCQETTKWVEWIGKGCVSTIGCNGTYRRIRLFADSNSDWLDPKWPVETLARFLDAIRTAPNVDVLLLTKRIELFNQRILKVSDWAEDTKQARVSLDLFCWIENEWMDGSEPENLWLGVSVENQKAADERIPPLLQIPAAVRFLSVEPLLEMVDLVSTCRSFLTRESGDDFHYSIEGEIDWVIVSGESGKNRRDCGVAAIESVADQCLAAGVPCYVKQDCAFKSGQQGRISDKYWALKQFPLREAVAC